MTETARWKMIATVAVAFSFGNVFAIACGTGSGGDSANASEGNDDGGDGGGDGGDGGTNPPDAALEAEVLRLGNEVAGLKCFIGHMTDDRAWSADGLDEGSWVDSQTSGDYDRVWSQGLNSDSSKAYDDCF